MNAEQREKTNRAAERLGDVLNHLQDGIITLDAAITEAKESVEESEERSQIAFFKRFMNEYFQLFTTEQERKEAFFGLLEVIRGELRYLKTGVKPLFTREDLLGTIPDKAFRLEGSTYFYGDNPVGFSNRERQACDYFMRKEGHIASASEVAEFTFGNKLDTAKVSDFIYRLNKKVGITIAGHKLIEQISKTPTAYKLYTTNTEYLAK